MALVALLALYCSAQVLRRALPGFSLAKAGDTAEGKDRCARCCRRHRRCVAFFAGAFFRGLAGAGATTGAGAARRRSLGRNGRRGRRLYRRRSRGDRRRRRCLDRWRGGNRRRRRFGCCRRGGRVRLHFGRAFAVKLRPSIAVQGIRRLGRLVLFAADFARTSTGGGAAADSAAAALSLASAVHLL